jgi:uncharacterized protein YpmB
MKIVTQIFLSILFLVSFTLLLATSTIKFQILNYNFLVNSFYKHNVYEDLSTSIKASFDKQVKSEGGNKNDIQVLTDLITPDNTADFVNKNLKNSLDFLDGKNKELIVYVPVSKIPKNLISKRISSLSEEMSIKTFASEINFRGIENIPFEEAVQIYKYNTYLWVISGVVSVIFLILLFLQTEKGKNFSGLGISILLSGLVTFVFANIVYNLQLIILGKTVSDSLQTVLLTRVLPPVLNNISRTWNIYGCVLVVTGLVFLFVRKQKA